MNVHNIVIGKIVLHHAWMKEVPQIISLQWSSLKWDYKPRHL